jgi:hypothetical protein
METPLGIVKDQRLDCRSQSLDRLQRRQQLLSLNRQRAKPGAGNHTLQMLKLLRSLGKKR